MLGNFMTFTKRDNVLGRYVDYARFRLNEYDGSKDVMFYRDNDSGIRFGNIQLVKFRISGMTFILKMYASLGGERTIQLGEIKRLHQKYIMQLGGKGIKVLHDFDLRDDFFSVLAFFHTKTVDFTRIDYAVDCATNFLNKKNSLNYKQSGTISKGGDVEYKVFGSKGKSAYCIRYYNKKIDLKESGYNWLYPQYEDYPKITRYELQVNSKGIPPALKNQKIKYLPILFTYGEVKKNKVSHKSNGFIDLEFRTVCNYLKELYKTKNPKSTIITNILKPYLKTNEIDK